MVLNSYIFVRNCYIYHVFNVMRETLMYNITIFYTLPRWSAVSVRGHLAISTVFDRL